MADIKQDNFIQLKKDSILRIGIKDFEGNDTGEHLEFDLEDIELPLRLSRCEEMHKKNVQYVKMQFQVIDKREDKKGKGLLSYNEKEKIKVLKEFYEREEKALDLFLGKGGTRKLLNGRKPYFRMYSDIADIIAPILPKLEIKKDNIIKEIQNNYSNNEENVLK